MTGGRGDGLAFGPAVHREVDASARGGGEDPIATAGKLEVLPGVGSTSARDGGAAARRESSFTFGVGGSRRVVVLVSAVGPPDVHRSSLQDAHDEPRDEVGEDVSESEGARPNARGLDRQDALVGVVQLEPGVESIAQEGTARVLEAS